MRTGLVLEGGGLRSLFSEGVFDVLLEAGIGFDGMIGVSAGASIGCNFKSRQIGRALRYNSRFANDWRYISLRSWLQTGDLVGADFAYHVMPFVHDPFDFDAWRENPMEFYAVCTDVDTGEPVYQRIGEMTHEGMDWLRASSSMPIVSRPVSLGGRRLLDGGIVNSIPLEYFQSIGYERNVVILTQPKGFFKKRTRLMPFFHLFCRRYPQVIAAMARRHEMYNAQLRYIAEQERLGRILVIAPDSPLPIGRTEMNPAKMHHVYDLGRKEGLSMIQQVQEFLGRE